MARLQFPAAMDTKQAKDFLVAQAVEQAAIEGKPLLIETQMMYFTKSLPAWCPDPLALNDEFEAQFEMPEYEAKIFKLLEHARERRWERTSGSAIDHAGAGYSGMSLRRPELSDTFS